MSGEQKKLKGITIEIRKTSVKFIPEDKTYPWWREQLDRNKEGILCPQIMQDMQRIASNLTVDNEEGQRIGKYNFFITNLSPNPKSSQGRHKVAYREALVSKLQKRKDELLKFKDKKVLVYVGIYLRKKRFKTHDVDNFLKAIIDALKPFVGDDSKIVSILADKKELENYPTEDLDFLEQIFIVVTDPSARADILK